MKNLFTLIAICLTVSAFPQDTKKDTANPEHGAMIYDARISRHMSTDPKRSKENNLNTSKYKLIEIYALRDGCLDTTSERFSSIGRVMVMDLNKMNGLKGEFITITGNNWCMYDLTNKRKMQEKYQGEINQNELKISDEFSLFIIERDKNLLFIAPCTQMLYVYALTKKNDPFPLPLLKKIYLIEIFKLSAKQFNTNFTICK